MEFETLYKQTFAQVRCPARVAVAAQPVPRRRFGWVICFAAPLLLAAGVLYPLNFVLHPIDSVILMTLFVAWLLSGTARLNSFDPKPASQSEPQKEPAE